MVFRRPERPRNWQSIHEGGTHDRQRLPVGFLWPVQQSGDVRNQARSRDPVLSS